MTNSALLLALRKAAPDFYIAVEFNPLTERDSRYIPEDHSARYTITAFVMTSENGVVWCREETARLRNKPRGVAQDLESPLVRRLLSVAVGKLRAKAGKELSDRKLDQMDEMAEILQGETDVAQGETLHQEIRPGINGGAGGLPV